MAIKSANPYLILNGRANQALELYKSLLDGEVTTVQRFGDIDQSCPEANRNLIMHAELKLGSALLMVSDGMAEGPVPGEGAVKVALAVDTEAELRRIFDGLSAGGQVVQAPLSAPFGMFCSFGDRFGVCWMLTSPNA
jgi:PhnB protein